MDTLSYRLDGHPLPPPRSRLLRAGSGQWIPRNREHVLTEMSAMIDQIDQPTRSAGRRGAKAITRKERMRIERKRKARQMTYKESMLLAEEFGVHVAEDMPLHEVQLKTFRRIHALWMQAASKVDALDPEATPGEPNSLWFKYYDEHGNTRFEPSKWLQLETNLRQELFDAGIRLGHLDIDARRVLVEEAQLTLLQDALATAAARLGLSEAQRVEFGDHFRQAVVELTQAPQTKTPDIEGKAVAA